MGFAGVAVGAALVSSNNSHSFNLPLSEVFDSGLRKSPN